MTKHYIFTLVILFCLLYTVDAKAQLFKNKKKSSKSGQEWIERDGQQADPNKGVLENPSGFEMYGQEDPEIPAELAPEPATTNNKADDAGPSFGMEEEKPGVFTWRKRRTNIAKEDAPVDNQILRKRQDPNVISVDLGVLYKITYDPVTVESNRQQKEIDFKTKEDIKYFYNQAMLKVKSKNYEEALEYLNKCIADKPYDKELLQLRGNTLVELDRYRKAVNDYQTVLELDQTDPAVYYNLGAAYAKLGKSDEAVNAFNEAITLKPNYTLAIQARGASKTMMNEYKAAIEDYNLVLDQNAFFAPAIRGRGIAKSLLSRYDEAISDFSSVIDIQPNDGLAYYYRGLAYCSNNEMYKGCSDLDKAYQLKIPQAYEDIKLLCR